jgi:hypothetical protein
MTWPLVARFGNAVLGPPGDNLEYVWKMWWFKHALVDLRVSPLFVPGVFYPFGYPLALSETTMAHTVLGLPLTALCGEVAAYNAMMYASFVLSGWAAYLLARELGCGNVGALIGGLIFAYSPYRLAHLGAGHLPLMGTAWIALAFLALERLIRKPTLGRGALLGLFLALMTLSSWYYALIVVPFAALYLLLRARPARLLLWRGKLWGGLALAGALCALLSAPAALPLLELYARGEMGAGYSLGYVDRWSASPADFVYPNAMHPWWGAALTRGYYQNVHENMLYLGLVALALAGVGLWSRRGERLPRVMAALGAIAFVCALGTTLHWAGKPVYLRVPAQVEYQLSRAMYVLTGRLALHKVDYSPLRREGAIPVPLPGLWLYLFVPAMGAMRVWARFGMVSILAVSVLAAWGAQWLLARVGGQAHPLRARLAGLALGALVLVDVAAFPYPYGFTEVRGQPVDEWLAKQPAGTPIIEYPLERTWYGWMLYPARVHGQPMAYGYGTFAPKAYREGIRPAADWPSEAALETLRGWGIRYVLVGERGYGAEWPQVQRAMAAMPALKEVASFQDQPIYHGDRLLRLLPPTADVPASELVSGARQGYLEDRVHVYAIQ